MRLLDKYIVFSSIFAMFTEDFTIHYIIDLKLFYLVLISNLILLLTKRKLQVNKNLLILLSFFFLHGLVMFLFIKSPLTSLLAQLTGISLSSIYYYNLLKTYGSKFLFKKYLDMAFALALIAILIFLVNMNYSERLDGILAEPAHYAMLMLPALYTFFRKKNYFKFFIILITILLSRSTLGYIGLFLMIIIPLFKAKYFVKYSIFTLIIISLTGYYVSTKWNEKESNFFVRRIKDTSESLNVVNTGKFKKYTNLSSYALLSNVFITKKSFLQHPLGSGLGSYKHEYEKYYPQMTPPKYIIQLKLSKINKSDACSLFLRMLLDFGIFGLLLVLYFIYRSIKVFKNDNKIFEQSVFFYLSLKLMRDGHYFPPEFHFFLLIFLKDFDEDITHS